MKFFYKIGKKILESSNSFNYYKKDYEKNKNKIKKLERDNKKLEKRIKKLEDSANTTNRLFNTSLKEKLSMHLSSCFIETAIIKNLI